MSDKSPVHVMMITGGDHIHDIWLGVSRWHGDSQDEDENSEYVRTYQFNSYHATPASIDRVLRAMHILKARTK